MTPPYQGSEKSQKPIISRKIKIIVWGCLTAQMKSFHVLITTQKKTRALCEVPFLKTQQKKRKKIVIFEKWSFWAIFLAFSKMGLCRALGFLRCDQCIKTLNFSYQTPPYDDFHFLAYNGLLRFFRPLEGGLKNKFSKFSKLFSALLWQKATKTICPGNLSLMIAKK